MEGEVTVKLSTFPCGDGLAPLALATVDRFRWTLFMRNTVRIGDMSGKLHKTVIVVVKEVSYHGMES